MSTTFRNLVTKCDCRQRPARGQVLTGVIGQPYSRSAPSSIGVDGIGPTAAMVSAGDRVTGTAVRVHDFIDPGLGKAIPYGIYDLSNDEGWVSVGDTADTAEFAANTIRRWWHQMGQHRFGDATRLLITADAGGSNGYRIRAWKTHLAALATETGLTITVCHYPPGTSKWNKIEHRMFSFITLNWRGRPLTSIRTIVELIAATTTKTGLTIQADHDPTEYPKGVKVSDAELAAIPLTRHDWHGDWNYTIRPT